MSVASGVGRATRLDEVMPRFDFSRAYRLSVPAPAAVTFAALESYDIRESRTARVLMFLRGYGLRAARPAAPQGLVASVTQSRFVGLGERPGREHVFGLAGRFWTPGGGLRTLTAGEFEAFEEEGCAKAAWNLAVEPAGESGSLLTTETRILCFGKRAQRLFGLYWHTIEIFSGAIRISMLSGIRKRAIANRGAV
ncbi:MAG: hypothetical protein LC796_07415 [Acidobacteria bacterium]|nr:hypothetical protein [Acidobacteriota bacterium]MCA1611639.1 hypothetical protein [Acidobacteriota bacterium]